MASVEQKIKNKAWREANPDKLRKYNQNRKGKYKAYNKDWYLYKKFGITQVIYDEILKNQSGVCKICQKLNKNGIALAVDHAHLPDYANLPPEEKQKCIRGLLCTNCNLLLGKAEDNPELLEAATIYLRRYYAQLSRRRILAIRSEGNCKAIAQEV